MATCDIQVGVTLDVTLTLIDCKTNLPIDISTQTSMEIILLGPGAVRLVLTASFVTDGTDGKMEATVSPGSLSVNGKWKVQGIATLSGGIERKSKVKTFDVRANI